LAAARSSWFSRRTAFDEADQAALDAAALQKHAPAALLADQAYVGAEPDHQPGRAATRMRLAQEQPITGAQLEHRLILG
jgi:hypothetical protein